MKDEISVDIVDQGQGFTFLLSYSADGAAVWKWENGPSGRGEFQSFIDCLKDAARHGYRGGGISLDGAIRYSRGGRLSDDPQLNEETERLQSGEQALA